MARNELLVSNVSRDGAPQGSAQLTINDTSQSISYTVTYEDYYFGKIANLQNLYQAWHYYINLVPDRIVPGNKLYVRLINGDGTKWQNVASYDPKPDGSFKIDVAPTYIVSMAGYAVDFEISQDPNFGSRVHLVNARTQGASSATATIKPNRESGPQNIIYEGEDIKINVTVSGAMQSTGSGQSVLTIGGLPATVANGHVTTDHNPTMFFFNGVGGTTLTSKQDGQGNTNLPIRFVLGDVSATATLLEPQVTTPNGRYHYQSNVWEFNLGAGATKVITILTAVLVPASSDWDPAAGGLTGLYIPAALNFRWDVIDGGYGKMGGASNYKAILSSWQHANYDRNWGTTSDPLSVIKGILDAGNGQVASATGVVREFDGLRIEVLEEGQDPGVVLPRRKTKYRITNNSTSPKRFNMMYGQMGFLRNNNPDSHGVRGATIVNGVTIDGEFVNRPEQSLINDGLIIVSDS